MQVEPLFLIASTNGFGSFYFAIFSQNSQNDIFYIFFCQQHAALTIIIAVKMKKIYTYGKYKSRNLVVDDWDELLGAKSNTEYV